MSLQAAAPAKAASGESEAPHLAEMIIHPTGRVTDQTSNLIPQTSSPPQCWPGCREDTAPHCRGRRGVTMECGGLAVWSQDSDHCVPPVISDTDERNQTNLLCKSQSVILPRQNYNCIFMFRQYNGYLYCNLFINISSKTHHHYWRGKVFHVGFDDLSFLLNLKSTFGCQVFES